jgi:hypothetical protein
VFSSRSSSTSHLRLAAFRVRLAGGEATVAGGVGDGGGGVVCAVAPKDGWRAGSLVAAATGARLRRRRRRRAWASAGALASTGGTHRRQEIETS